ncbi:MAG TPA: acyl-CoA dehydrogenase, partial [Acidimicrobiales bacterium]|nr:acyl-CoA dehydrogenase [Acidimicrobiales bacterium]
VGVEGLSIAERAYQAALQHAQQRRQGRAIGAPATESSFIVEHPDVRRMLLTMKAYIEAMRCLLYTNAVSVDLARHHDDPSVREARQQLLDLLTPVGKAWCTDLGVEVTSLAVQVHGGMGYVEETGVAQHFRDSRIAPIYEGTNGIQAIDLVARKVPMRGGGVVKDLLAQMEALDGELASCGEALAEMRVQLGNGVTALREATDWLMAQGLAAPNDALAGATPYLRMFGLVTGGWLLARSAVAASRLSASPSGPQRGFLEEKIATARFYCGELLPQAGGLLPAVTAGAGPLFDIDLSRATLG